MFSAWNSSSGLCLPMDLSVSLLVIPMYAKWLQVFNWPCTKLSVSSNILSSLPRTSLLLVNPHHSSWLSFYVACSPLSRSQCYSDILGLGHWPCCGTVNDAFGWVCQVMTIANNPPYWNLDISSTCNKVFPCLYWMFLYHYFITSLSSTSSQK